MIVGPIWILFAATGVVFWVWFLLLSVALIFSIENDAPGWAFTSLVTAAAILLLFSDVESRYQLHQYLTLKNVIVFLVGYFSIAVLYSFLKWYLFLSERLERWREAVSDYRKKYGPTAPIALDAPRFKEFIRDNYREFLEINNNYNGEVRKTPRAQDYKPRIIAWMVYWPWSLCWSLLDDVITGMFRFIYRKISYSYDAMSDWMFKGSD